MCTTLNLDIKTICKLLILNISMYHLGGGEDCCLHAHFEDHDRNNIKIRCFVILPYMNSNEMS